jgi:hypothetical protein
VLVRAEKMTGLAYADQKSKGLQRKLADAASWLICIADNSITIENSNLKLNALFNIFDSEMESYVRSLSTGTFFFSVFSVAMN